MDLVSAAMLTGSSSMPAPAPVAMSSSRSDFAAMLAPMTGQITGPATENNASAASPNPAPQNNTSNLGAQSKGTPRSAARGNDREPARGGDSTDKAHEPQGDATRAVPAPTPVTLEAVAPKGTEKSDSSTSASAQASDSKSQAGSDLTGAAQEKGFVGLIADAVSQDSNSTATDAGLMQGETVAASPTEAKGAFAPDQLKAVAAGEQTADHTPSAPDKSVKPVAPENVSQQGKQDQPPAPASAPGAAQDQAAKDALSNAVKSAVNQASVHSSKEGTSKPVSGHSVEGKMSAANQGLEVHTLKTGGNEAGSSHGGHNPASGQGSGKKNSEFDSNKNTQFAASFDAAQTKPASRETPETIATRVSPDQSSVPADGKVDTVAADGTALPTDPRAAALADAAAANDFARPASLVHSTALLDQIGRSELKVGMRAGEFGNVEIRTQMHDQQLKAEISVEHRDLGHILSSDLPALQQKLQQSDISLASLTVRNQSAQNGGSFQGETRGQQQFFLTPQTGGIAGVHAESTLSSEELREGTGGLDIRI